LAALTPHKRRTKLILIVGTATTSKVVHKVLSVTKARR
jgi:hypothetical protein